MRALPLRYAVGWQVRDGAPQAGSGLKRAIWPASGLGLNAGESTTRCARRQRGSTCSALSGNVHSRFGWQPATGSSLAGSDGDGHDHDLGSRPPDERGRLAVAERVEAVDAAAGRALEPRPAVAGQCSRGSTSGWSSGL